MKSKYLFFVIPFLFFACKSDTDFFSGKNISNKLLKINTIQVDTLNFETIESSYNGTIEIFNKKLYFLDKQFGYFFEFDQRGKFLSKLMGQGQGPKEINTAYIDGFLYSKTKEYFFIGSSSDIHVHDSLGNRKKTFITNWNDKIGQEKIGSMKDYNGDENSLYGFEYEKLIVRGDSKNNLYIPIQSFYDNFNAYTKEYYQKSRILAKLNTKKGAVDEILGRRSPEYLKYNYVGHHSFFSFDINKLNEFYISFEIDSLIYVYDKNFINKYSYGFKGTNMDTNYKELYNPIRKEIVEAYMEDRPTRGYYTNIEYFDEFDILFRSYKKGEHSKYNGLQIYKGTTLIGDVEVPKNLNWVKGYIYPYFYSNALLSDENLTLKSYRFKLPEELLKK